MPKRLAVYAYFDIPVDDERTIEEIAADMEAKHGSLAQLVHAHRKERVGLMVRLRDTDTDKSVHVELKPRSKQAE